MLSKKVKTIYEHLQGKYKGLPGVYKIEHLFFDGLQQSRKPVSHLVVLQVLQEIDALAAQAQCPLFKNDPRLQENWARMQSLDTEEFFKRWLPKLRKYRESLWSEAISGKAC
jgi:hypothetical protein